MTVKQLMDELSEQQPDDEVVIPVETGRDLGSEPHVKVSHISRGFDWDKGKVFLRPPHGWSLKT